jgi:hypothetical protein
MLRAYDEGRQRPAFWGNTRVKGWQPTENAKRGANPAPWLQEEGLAYVEPLDAAHTDPETQVGPSWFQEVALKLQEL